MDVSYSVRSPTGVSLFSNSALPPSERESIPNTQDSNGRTSLHHAVINASVKEVERCLSSGAAVDIVDSNGDQPLHLAAAGAFQEIVRLLLKCGADVDAKGHGGKSPLHLSLRSPKTVKTLLKWHPIVSSQDNNGDTPLHLAMVSSTFNDPPKGSIIETLIQSGANVNTRNLKQITPFHMALERPRSVGKYHTSWVVMFLENRADVLLRAGDDRFPFEIFLENINLRYIKFPGSNEPLDVPARCFKLFVDKGGNLDAVLKSGEPLVNDVLNGVYSYVRDINLAQFLCETCDLTKAGASGDYPLHCILKRPSGYYPVKENLVKAILNRGADTNQINQAGQSPLIILLSHKCETFSFRSDDTEITEILLERRADPMLKDVSGNLPIYLAIRNYKGGTKEKLVKLLLKAMVSGEMPTQSSLLGASDQTDQQWWNSYHLLYRRASWYSPEHLAELSNLLPADVADELCKMALSLLAEKFLESLKASVETAQAGESLDHWVRKFEREQLVNILRDCRSLKIDVDLSWYHFLLDLQE
jgi:ankyrin repeat protein